MILLYCRRSPHRRYSRSPSPVRKRHAGPAAPSDSSDEPGQVRGDRDRRGRQQPEPQQHQQVCIVCAQSRHQRFKSRHCFSASSLWQHVPLGACGLCLAYLYTAVPSHQVQTCCIAHLLVALLVNTSRHGLATQLISTAHKFRHDHCCMPPAGSKAARCQPRAGAGVAAEVGV
jgi:hypothetical protein